MEKIIDVSEFQGEVNFAKVRADGINGVILRCGLTGYGADGNRYTDAWWERHYAAAKEAGMKIGAYYYSCA